MLNVLRFSQRFLIDSRPILRIAQRKFHCNAIFYCDKNSNNKSNDTDAIKHVAPNIANKYEAFSEKNTTVILDMEEEREKMLAGELETEEVTVSGYDIYEGLNTERGKTGVFDIEDLVAILKRDNADNLVVCTVPKHLKYVDYMVIVTARSHRHMKALAEFVRKMYKIKRNKADRVPRIEGKNSDEWLALDLGNIALHIFSAKVRKQYDIELLWSVGAEYDTETHKPGDRVFELYDQHSMMLSEFSRNNDAKQSNPIDDTAHLNSKSQSSSEPIRNPNDKN